MAPKNRKKEVSRAVDPLETKRPRGKVDQDAKFRWLTNVADLGGPFPWTQCDHNQLFREVIPRLHNLESNTWHTLHMTGSHPISVDKICKLAHDRLHEIGKTQCENLYSLRLTGRERIWGIKIGYVFHLLWWDPGHQICPSPLKHT